MADYVTVNEGTAKKVGAREVTEGSNTLYHQTAVPAAGLLTLPSSETLDIPEWAASTAKSVGDWVLPTTSNGYYYECTTAGTTGTDEPTWPTTPGQTVTDGTVEWTCRDYAQSSAVTIEGKGRIIAKISYSDSSASVNARILFLDANGTEIGWTEEVSVPNPGISDGSRYSGEIFVVGNEVGAKTCKIRLTSAPSDGDVKVYIGAV